MQLDKALKVSIELAKKAGQAILEVYEKDFEVEYKEDTSPLTEADQKSNDIIVAGVREAFPQYSVLSEEAKEDVTRFENDWCWVIDPLDGTKEFIKKNGEFTVNIALAYQQRVVLGVIYVPVTEELYYATKGQGAFYEKDGKVEKISVTKAVDNLRLVCSRSHASDQLKALIEEHKAVIKETKSAGSSLKGCLVAKGEAEMYYRFGPTMEWDTAAMQCIAEEAGAIFRQMDGTEMLYNRENSLNDKGFYIINRVENLFV